MNYKIAIFDLDGTLLDTLADLSSSLNRSLREFGFAEQTADEVRAHVGNGSAKLLELSVPGGKSNPQYGSILSFYGSWYDKHCRIETKPYPGIIELLRRLKNDGVLCCVVSNKPDAAVKALCAHFFSGLVSAAAGERQGILRKPSPDALTAVLAELGADRRRAVYIGDSEVDIETASNADMPCISVTWGFRSRSQLEKAGAVSFAGSADELYKLISG